MGSMNRHRVIWVAFAVAIVAVALLTWSAVVSPRMQQISAADEQTAQITRQNTETQNTIDTLSLASVNIILETNRLNQLERQIPSSYEQPAFITSLNKAASSTKVSIQSVSFGTASDAVLPTGVSGGITSGRLVQVPVSISASGDYTALRGFVAAIQGTSRIAIPTSLSYSIGSGDTQSTVSITCTIWSLLSTGSVSDTASSLSSEAE